MIQIEVSNKRSGTYALEVVLDVLSPDGVNMPPVLLKNIHKLVKNGQFLAVKTPYQNNNVQITCENKHNWPEKLHLSEIETAGTVTEKWR